MSVTSRAGTSRTRSKLPQRDALQVRHHARVGVGLCEAHQAHARVAHQRLHDRGFRCHGEEHGVDLAGEQRIGGGLPGRRHQRGRSLVNPVDAEKGQREMPRTAAVGADGDAPPLQRRQCLDCLGAPVEDPQGLDHDAAERGDAGRLLAVRDAALEQGHVHPRAAGEQAHILDRAARREDAKVDPRSPQHVGIALPERIVGAARTARRDHQLGRRGGRHQAKQPPHAPDRE
jgi:hypothetical protein